MLLNTAPSIERETSLEKSGTLWIGKFQAMSCPCEVLIDHCGHAEARHALDITSKEAWRIEQKFSRFLDHSVTGTINANAGEALVLDNETNNLLDCANTLFDLSEGLFDITAGVLRKVWHFNQSDQIPKQHQIDELLPYIGWHKVHWKNPELHLPKNMQLDFGGIGKEYAVDRSLALLSQANIHHVLVNFGGDIAANAPHANGSPWNIGIENIAANDLPDTVIQLYQGGIATSGDQRRYIEHKGTRYSHILNPKTGWPIKTPHKTITTLAASATEAGMYATLALLSGEVAPQFLNDSEITHWIQN